MELTRFISVGENIHCTRSYKVGGKFVKEENGNNAVAYKVGDEARKLNVPQCFVESADWEAGKVRHCAVAMWQATNGTDGDKAAGIDYLQNLAKRQEASGATYLDLNVDEFSTDVEERVNLMKWLVGAIQQAVAIPMSIDSSNIDILRAGIASCDTSRGRPMLNSVSLERMEALEVVKEFAPVVVASAAGESDLPTTVEDKIANLDKLIPELKAAGLEIGDIHIDPLVFPIATDGNNGKVFLDAVKAVKDQYGQEVHTVAGLSNISFGMPNRKLITQVFTYLSVEAGGDGGIVDPFQINMDILNSMDTESEAFKLTKALLMGEDEFGMEFIMASREGTI